MPDFKCYPYSNPDALWIYCPSYGAAILFTILFSIPTLVHITQAFMYRKPFAVVIIMGSIWELAGYIFRILSVVHQLDVSIYTAQQLLILLAPLWINAFVYMVLGRMIHFFLPEDQDRIFGIKARRITLMFVLFDISAFLVQAAGGSLTNNTNPPQIQRDGLHIYMGGVGLQLLFISIFLTLTIKFQQILARQGRNDLEHYNEDQINYSTTPDPDRSPRTARKLLLPIYLTLGLIIYRNIYRLIEYSSGVESSITRKEWFTYFFDALPMLAALLIFNFAHPGRFLKGPRSDFSEENKKLKALKREKKQQKKEEKAEKKRIKKEEKADKKRRKQEK